jgi:RNA polymerase sigma-70 factor (ECF subfamily)
MTRPADSGIPRQTDSHEWSSQLRIDSGPETHARRTIAARFAQAFRSGDASHLTQLLAADVTFVADGGGKASAARRPLAGRDDVLTLLVGIHRSAYASGVASHATIDMMEVNSEPALVLRVDGHVDGVFVLSIEESTIAAIRVIRNPDKLAYLKRQLAAIMAR